MDVLLLGILALLISALFCIVDERIRSEERMAYMRRSIELINDELISSENAAQSLADELCKR